MQKDLNRDGKKLELSPKRNKNIVSTSIINRRRILIGRSLNCDIVIYDARVSAIHAAIEIGANAHRIFDLNSRNGTFVNGKKVVSSEIKLGDSIALAEIDFIFQEQKDDLPPPVLDILQPGLPPLIQEGSKPKIDFDLPRFDDEPNKKLPSRPIAFKKESEEVPSVVYPLNIDPKAEFSEYIFEEVDDLYPIFKYDVKYQSVEVIILHKDRVFSVDYIPLKTGTYFIKGFQTSDDNKTIEYPYLAKDEKFPFITVSGADVTIQQPHDYESFYLSDKDEKKAESPGGVYYLEGQDVLRFTKGFNSIFCRLTDPPPRVANAPLFRRDPEFKKYLFIMIFYMLVFLSAMVLYPVNEELEKEKIPKKLRTIVYKPKFRVEKAKLTASKTPAITKTKNAPKKVQKSPNQKIVEKTPKQKIEKKPTPKVAEKKSTPKPVGKKSAPKVVKVKKADKAGPVAKKNANQTRKSRAPKIGGKAANSQPSPRRAAPSKSKGHVDTYKAVNLKSTINSMFAKGGAASGAKVKGASGASSGYTELSTGGSEVGSIQRAKVGQNLGSLTGAATGRLSNTKGAEGLVGKRTLYTAGIPSNTVVLGSMDPDIIRRILRDHIPQFRYCYQRELDKSSKEFSGIIKLNFTIGASGNVTRAGMEAGSGLPGSVRGCVVNVLRGIKFPEPRGGGNVGVRQPMNFYPNVR